jgi:hypothetical protein
MQLFLISNLLTNHRSSYNNILAIFVSLNSVLRLYRCRMLRDENLVRVILLAVMKLLSPDQSIFHETSHFGTTETGTAKWSVAPLPCNHTP